MPVVPNSKLGKWLLFAKRGEDINKLWKTLCQLYKEKMLQGVRTLKMSTERESERSSSEEGVICVSCGPYDDEQAVM